MPALSVLERVMKRITLLLALCGWAIGRSYILRVSVRVVVISRRGPPVSTMASEDSSVDLQSLLPVADAQDLVDESFVARALLQPETDPWEVCLDPFLCTLPIH